VPPARGAAPSVTAPEAPFADLVAEPAESHQAPPRPARGRSGCLLGGAVAAALVVVAAGVWLLAGVLLRVKTPHGTILLELDPADAEVSVDGRQVRVSLPGDREPIKIEVPRGKHELKVTRGGFQAFSRELTLQAARDERVKVTLVPEAHDAIDRGVAYLKRLQKPDGTWPRAEVIAITALAGLTLLECGVPPEDPAIQNAADAIRRAGEALTRTYALALSILFFDRLGDPEDIPLIESMTVRLLAGQSSLGGWTYECPKTSDAEMRRLAGLRGQKKPARGKKQPRPGAGKRTANDSSPEIREQLKALDSATPAALKAREDADDNHNTQYAALALWVARRNGLPTEHAVALVDARFRACQKGDGGWDYVCGPGAPGSASTATMTCAGLFGLALGYAVADPARAHPDPAKDPVLRSGLVALSRNVGNPVGDAKGLVPVAKGNQLYYLWSLERVAVTLGLKTVGGRDWYAWGTEIVTASQQPDGSWQGQFAEGGAGTCFALLFLRRADLAPDLTRALQGKATDPGAGADH
jgi:hypothetical protein